MGEGGLSAEQISTWLPPAAAMALLVPHFGEDAASRTLLDRLSGGKIFAHADEVHWVFKRKTESETFEGNWTIQPRHWRHVHATGQSWRDFLKTGDIRIFIPKGAHGDATITHPAFRAIEGRGGSLSTILIPG